MGGLSPLHLILILGIALIVIGPGRLPETGAALGKAIRSFRDAVDGSTAVDGATETSTAPTQPPSTMPQQPPAPPDQFAPTAYPVAVPPADPQPDRAETEQSGTLPPA